MLHDMMHCQVIFDTVHYGKTDMKPAAVFGTLSVHVHKE